MGKDKEKKELMESKGSGRLHSPFEEMERYFDDFMRNPFSLLMRPQWRYGDISGRGEIVPSADIYEDDNNLVVKAELPGISKDELNVTITRDTITISGEKKSEEKVEKKNYHRLERSYGSFCRSFRLPDHVDSDKAEAIFKDGVLEIRVPKSEESRHKKIEIK